MPPLCRGLGGSRQPLASNCSEIGAGSCGQILLQAWPRELGLKKPRQLNLWRGKRLKQKLPAMIALNLRFPTRHVWQGATAAARSGLRGATLTSNLGPSGWQARFPTTSFGRSLSEGRFWQLGGWARAVLGKNHDAARGFWGQMLVIIMLGAPASKKPWPRSACALGRACARQKAMATTCKWDLWRGFLRHAAVGFQCPRAPRRDACQGASSATSGERRLLPNPLGLHHVHAEAQFCSPSSISSDIHAGLLTFFGQFCSPSSISSDTHEP